MDLCQPSPEARIKSGYLALMKSFDPTPEIIGAAIKVHRKLGPGLLESTYEACLAHELQLAGMRVDRQRTDPLIYGAVKLEWIHGRPGG